MNRNKEKNTILQWGIILGAVSLLLAGCGNNSSTGATFSEGSSSSAEVQSSSSSEVVSSSSISVLSSSSEIVYGSLTDSRDGQTYKTVVIGTQTWMAQNLNYKVSNSWCYNCSRYGRLYLPATKSNCPDGWHLPSNDEWRTLKSYVDANNGSEDVAVSLKSTTGWSDNGNGLDRFGFSALPGGEYIEYFGGGGYFDNVGEYAFFWSSTNYNTNYAYLWRLQSDDDDFYSGGSANLGAALSVRCIQN